MDQVLQRSKVEPQVKQAIRAKRLQSKNLAIAIWELNFVQHLSVSHALAGVGVAVRAAHRGVDHGAGPAALSLGPLGFAGAPVFNFLEYSGRV